MVRKGARGEGHLCFSCPAEICCFGSLVQEPYTWQQGLGEWAKGDYWTDLITQYNQRSTGFTYQSDILPALSALARSYSTAATIPETDYVAGLWKSSLLEHLFWVPLQQEKKATDLETHLKTRFSRRYICPSWSWLMQGYFKGLMFQGEVASMRAEHAGLETRIVHKGKDLLGEITGGELLVVGKLSSVPDSQLVRVVELRPEETMVRYEWTTDTRGGHQWGFYLDWDPEGDSYCSPHLKMLVMVSFNLVHSSETGLAGLLLYKVDPTNTENKFYRVGVFRSAWWKAQCRGSATRFFQHRINESVVVV